MLYVLRPSSSPDLMVSSDPLVGGWCTTSNPNEAFIGSEAELSAIAAQLPGPSYGLDRVYRMVGAFRKGIDCTDVPSAYLGRVLTERVGRPFSAEAYRAASERELIRMPQIFHITSVNHGLKWGDKIEDFEEAAETAASLNDLLRNGRVTFRTLMVTERGILAWLARIRCEVEQGS